MLTYAVVAGGSGTRPPKDDSRGGESPTPLTTMLTYADVCGLRRGIMSPHTTICGLRPSLYPFGRVARHHICVLILLNICPHTSIYVSSYFYVCVLILLHASSDLVSVKSDLSFGDTSKSKAGE
jgi:hypothetical protein